MPSGGSKLLKFACQFFGLPDAWSFTPSFYSSASVATTSRPSRIDSRIGMGRTMENDPWVASIGVTVTVPPAKAPDGTARWMERLEPLRLATIPALLDWAE